MGIGIRMVRLCFYSLRNKVVKLHSQPEKTWQIPRYKKTTTATAHGKQLGILMEMLIFTNDIVCVSVNDVGEASTFH